MDRSNKPGGAEMRPHRGLVSLRPGEEEEKGSNRRGGQSLSGWQGEAPRHCRGHLELTQGCPPPGRVPVVDRTEQQGGEAGQEGQALGVKELALVGAEGGRSYHQAGAGWESREKVRKQYPCGAASLRPTGDDCDTKRKH